MLLTVTLTSVLSAKAVIMDDDVGIQYVIQSQDMTMDVYTADITFESIPVTYIESITAVDVEESQMNVSYVKNEPTVLTTNYDFKLLSFDTVRVHNQPGIKVSSEKMRGLFRLDIGEKVSWVGKRSDIFNI